MHKFIIPTKRRLANAFRAAYENETLDRRLTLDKAQTVSFLGSCALFWPIGVCGNNHARLAYIHMRNDLSIYIGHDEAVNPNPTVEPWIPA